MFGLKKEGKVITPKELFEAYRIDVFRTCYYMVQNRQDAEDLCQDIFIKAYEHDFQRIEQLKPWLLSIAMNTCRNYLNRKKRLLLIDWTRNFLTPGKNTADHKAEQLEVQQDLHAALIKLPEKIRAVIILRFYHDLKFDDISAILQIPASTVKYRCSQGLELLERLLKTEEEGIEWRFVQ